MDGFSRNEWCEIAAPNVTMSSSPYNVLHKRRGVKGSTEWQKCFCDKATFCPDNCCSAGITKQNKCILSISLCSVMINQVHSWLYWCFPCVLSGLKLCHWQSAASKHCLGSDPSQGMWECCQWLWVRRWFSPDSLVSSTTYNWLVMIQPKYGRKSENVASDFGLGGGFRQILWFPPPLTTG